MKCPFVDHTHNPWGCFILMAVFLAINIALFEFTIISGLAEEPKQTEEVSFDFTSLSLEELKQVMIISVLKKPGKLSEATSAISVITHDDIRRSGATSLPELLRDVPGFQVAQINSSNWAVSARGFNHRYANKLLVLVDGRSIYTPGFSGVYWDEQDIMLEDVECIEVIRGPGATLWGANAVNGVINIITKKASDTQGGLVTSSLGNEEKRSGAFRYGSRLAPNLYSRLYLKYAERDDLVYTSGDESHDLWESIRGGGRLDWSLPDRNSFTLQGNIYDGQDNDEIFHSDSNYSDSNHSDPNHWEKKSFIIENNFSGGNILGRWRREFSSYSDLSCQLYYDKTKRVENYPDGSQYQEQFETIDLDLQQNLKLGLRHDLVWGLGYRFISDHFSARTEGRPFFLLDPDSRQVNIFSSFVQYGVDAIRDKLKLTLGSKFEHNDYTNFEIQPSFRMLFKATQNQNIWMAVSRAIRTPSRCEYDIMSPIGEFPHPSDETSSDDENPPPDPDPNYSYPEITRNPESEKLIAYELGYRLQPTHSFSLDIASFYNDYQNLMIIRDVKAKAQNYGLELAASWDLWPWWCLSASYAYLHMRVSITEQWPYFKDYADQKKVPPFDLFVEESNPEHQFRIHSSTDLGRNVEFDLDLRYVDDLYHHVEGYEELDARLGFSPRENLEFSLVGKNLLHDHHLEFLSQGYLPYSFGNNIEVERSVYGKITCRF